MWVLYNANPSAQRVGDCTIRAISKATNQSWEEVYLALCVRGLIEHDLPSANHVWGDYLESIGFERKMVEKRGYTVEDFTHNHPKGTYILAISGHVVACVDGDYYDTWQSGAEIVVYYWERIKDNE